MLLLRVFWHDGFGTVELAHRRRSALQVFFERPNVAGAIARAALKLTVRASRPSQMPWSRILRRISSLASLASSSVVSGQQLRKGGVGL
jgi:hypothetical protein